MGSPRIHGEKMASIIFSQSVLGSPPHTRGKDSPADNCTCWFRITPAYTGKATFPSGLWPGCRITPAYTGKRPCVGELVAHSQDHPRIHGEKDQMLQDIWGMTGSPPHTRGKVYKIFISFIQSGSTPAYTGKSVSHTHTGLASWDHPRIHGEKRN